MHVIICGYDKYVCIYEFKMGLFMNLVHSSNLDICLQEDPSGGASCLTDGDVETYWESDGMQGQHWIRLHMKKGTVVK